MEPIRCHRARSDRSRTARERVEERDGSCILCEGPGVDVHHRLPRGRGGARHERDIFALSRLVWLCRDDHRWVESHRLLAYGLGLLVRHGAHAIVINHESGAFVGGSDPRKGGCALGF